MALIEKLTAIANAIRGKTGKTDALTLEQMPGEIEGIQTGGGGDDVARALIERTITEFRDNTITSVGSNAFYSCASIVSIDLPNAMSAGAGAFGGCSSLVNVNLPKVSAIGGGCFGQCKELVRLVLPSLTTITTNSNQVFGGCSKLKTLDTYISGGALASYVLNGCKSLTQLILRGTGEICRLAASSSIGGTPIANGTGYVYVPRALLSDDDETKDYRRATNWSAYAAQFRALEDYTVDGTITGELDESKI